MSAPTYNIHNLDEREARHLEVARRMAPGQRSRVAAFMSEIAPRMAVEKVDRLFPGLMPMQRAWKIIAFNTYENAPEITIDNLHEHAALVGMSEQWNVLKRELPID